MLIKMLLHTQKKNSWKLTETWFQGISASWKQTSDNHKMTYLSLKYNYLHNIECQGVTNTWKISKKILFSGVILVYNGCFEQSAGNFTKNRTLPPVFFLKEISENGWL